MRRRNIKGADDKIKEYNVTIDPNIHSKKMEELFNNNNPLHIEIGMGKGDFILEMAKNNPDINFIGIEKYSSVLLQACKKIEEYKLNNLYIMSYDAINLLNIFNSKSIDRIYLNFSDPWPKKAHQKRRLTHSNFLNIYKELLTNSGSIWFKTDNRALFEFSICEIANYGFIIKNVSLDLHNSVLDFVNYETEYERKFGQNGPIYRLEAYLNETSNNN